MRNEIRCRVEGQGFEQCEQAARRLAVGTGKQRVAALGVPTFPLPELLMAFSQDLLGSALFGGVCAGFARCADLTFGDGLECVGVHYRPRKTSATMRSIASAR